MRRYEDRDYDRGYDRDYAVRDDDRRRGSYDYDERGFMDRAGDEVRMWFGDEEAERRRRMDEMYDRSRRRWDQDRDYSRRETGGYPRGDYGGTSDYGRSGYSRPGGNYSDRDYGRQSLRGGGEWRDRDYGRSEFNRGYGREPRGGREDFGQGGGRFENRGFSDRGYGESSQWNSPDRGYDTIYYTAYFFEPGPMSGRGPSGYTRSSDRLTEEVNEALTQHGDVDATNIKVRCENGEVTLEGNVGSRHEKRAAEEAAERVPGVSDVHNRLRVEREQHTTGRRRTGDGPQSGNGHGRTRESSMSGDGGGKSSSRKSTSDSPSRANAS